MIKNSQFSGDKKEGRSLLYGIEKKIVAKYVSKIPPWIETYHLTFLTILWSGLIILFSFFARKNINWLWLVSLMIFFQYLTDLFDGAVGRYRNTGLIRWGYYMDHLLDYLFLCSVLVGYSFVLPDKFKYLLFFILAVFGAFMVNSYLAFAVTNKFKIAYLKFGPTEIRILFIAVNTLLIIFGRTYMGKALPSVLFFSLAGLCFVVYKTQKYIWELDMESKKHEKQA